MNKTKNKSVLTWWLNTLKTTFVEFFKEKSFIHCAAVSYYTVLTLVPIIYLSFVSFGKIIGQETMVKIISETLKNNIGIDDVQGIIAFLDTVDFEKGSLVVEIIGSLALLFSATALLNALRSGINEYLDIEKKYTNRRKKIVAGIRSRAMSVLLLGGFGFIVIATYFAQTLLLGFGEQLIAHREGFSWLFLRTLQHALTIGSNILVFLIMFKYLNDGRMKWKLALAGATFTGILIYLGQLLIKYYLSHYFFAREGGLAGSILIILVWMYYSSHIIFLGAKFTSIYAKAKGDPIQID